jgi:hypothetical protein
MPMLAGNLVSSFLITVPLSLMAPQNYDFAATKAIEVVSDEKDLTNIEYSAEEEDPVELEKALRVAYAWAWALTGILIFLFPLPLLGEHYIFSEQFFTFWVVIGFIWTLLASFTTILYPVWEARHGAWQVLSGIILEIGGTPPSPPPAAEVKYEAVDKKAAETPNQTTHDMLKDTEGAVSVRVQEETSVV